MNDTLRDLALTAFLDAVAACDPGRAVRERVRASPAGITAGGARLDLRGVREVRVAALGKASPRMAAAASELLRGALGAGVGLRGLVVAHAFPHGPVSDFRTATGDHPVPGAHSFDAGAQLLELVRGCDARSAVLFLLSGGGSALAEVPAPGLAPADVVEAHELLLRADLDIRTVNAVRKRLSAIKGGQLARAASPARQLSLIVSDVPPGDPQSVAAGPTMPDDTGGMDLRAALERAGVWRRLPGAARAAVTRPTDDGSALAHGPAAVLIDSTRAAAAAADRLRLEGVRVTVLEGADGPVRDVAARHLAALAAMGTGGPRAVVSAGEATVDVRGDGRGGRNQETVLYSLLCAEDSAATPRGLTVLSAGTDGRDGATDAAGAVGDIGLLARARAAGLDPSAHLKNNDSFGFLAPLDALVFTGPTGTNVRDVRIYLA